MERIANPHLALFALGIAMAWARPRWNLPAILSKGFALFLLGAIGLKGGMALHASPPGTGTLAALAAAMLLSALLPVPSYALLRLKLRSADAAALAAAFGSVSLLTFLAGLAHLDRNGVEYGGHMIAAMALMEFPALLVALGLHRLGGSGGRDGHGTMATLKECLAGPSMMVLLGGLALGGIVGESALGPIPAALKAAFPMVLAAFLVEMGMAAARRWPDLKAAGAVPVAFAFLAPVVHGAIGLGAARLLGMPPGDAFLLALLCASASYIAVPAAVRMAIPEASPGLYLPPALGIAFPFNVLVGIPSLHAVIGLLWG